MNRTPEEINAAPGLFYWLNFMARRPPETVSYNMSKIRATNTGLELLFKKLLDGAGLEYARYYDVEGKPDFAFPAEKIAVFCDSDFWHGYRWRERVDEFSTNRKFWVEKITRNVDRDSQVNLILRGDGWKVLRFWEHAIRKSPEKCLSAVLGALSERRSIIVDHRR